MKRSVHLFVLFIMTMSFSLSCLAVGKCQVSLSSSTESDMPLSDSEDSSDDVEKGFETEVHETVFSLFRSGPTIVPRIVTVEIAHLPPTFIDSYAVSIYVPPLS